MLGFTKKNLQLTLDVLGLTNQNLDTDFIHKFSAMQQRYSGVALKSRPLDFLLEVVRVSRRDLDLDYISQIVASIKSVEESLIDVKAFKSVVELLALCDDKLDISYLSRVLEVIESAEEAIASRVKDSLSANQFKSKLPLIDAIESHKILSPQSTVVIWGCWFGTILIPYLQKRVARIVGIDRDDEVIRFAKNKLYYDSPTIELIADDIFSTHRSFYLQTDLIINTSCEHMPPMSQWPWFKHGAIATDPVYPRGEADLDPSKKRVFSSPKLSENCHFAFQSNNMVDIPDHINCVSSLQEFKAQLPKRAEVLMEDQIEDERGIRFLLLGKFK